MARSAQISRVFAPASVDLPTLDLPTLPSIQTYTVEVVAVLLALVGIMGPLWALAWLAMRLTW
jgi:hypothetical protein